MREIQHQAVVIKKIRAFTCRAELLRNVSGELLEVIGFEDQRHQR